MGWSLCGSNIQFWQSSGAGIALLVFAQIQLPLPHISDLEPVKGEVESVRRVSVGRGDKMVVTLQELPRVEFFYHLRWYPISQRLHKGQIVTIWVEGKDLLREKRLIWQVASQSDVVFSYAEAISDHNRNKKAGLAASITFFVMSLYCVWKSKRRKWKSTYSLP